jgi:hypothetical protein
MSIAMRDWAYQSSSPRLGINGPAPLQSRYYEDNSSPDKGFDSEILDTTGHVGKPKQVKTISGSSSMGLPRPRRETSNPRSQQLARHIGAITQDSQR